MTTLEARDRLSTETVSAQNVRQLAAIAGICNGASFLQSDLDKPVELRTVDGDATDSAILRFAELLAPIHKMSEPWDELYKVNFNSKTKFSECPDDTSTY